jgi:ribosomal protein S18 acetylase RimI-like enzyme
MMTTSTLARIEPVLLDGLVIRRGLREDLPSLEWEGEYAHYRNLYADTYKVVERGHAVMWLAEISGVGVIGQVFVSYQGGRPELADGCTRAYVYGFRVRPEYRNRGLGKRMMEVVEADLSARCFRIVTLNVARVNLGAQRFYERLGYRIVAADPGQWSYLDHLGNRQKVDEPAWRMEKELPRQS